MTHPPAPPSGPEPQPGTPEYAYRQQPTEPIAAPPGQQTWGTPQPAASPWTTKKSLAAVGIAAVIAAGGAGVIYAASGHSNTEHGPGGGPGIAMNGGPGGQSQQGQQGTGGQSEPGRAGTAPAAALHGQFVIAEGSTYVTETTQLGTVTAVSAESITAKSADDYTQTYTITASTTGASAVKVGDTVRILGTGAGGTSTATTITEGTGTGSTGGGFGAGRRGPGGSGGTGALADPGTQADGRGGPGFGGPGGRNGSGPHQFGGTDGNAPALPPGAPPAAG
ncbi:hypothetical protein [Nocardia aurantia]|uniref:DUF5666 domain-containing protein n=1 Tax=Nocardia aurantia TaxID=2585199 RepID=A0A7K0DM42_9NOCA|nr:hypothetical protein [Nocardia aurantia]MQY26382.1 hypothetical protein [Nocardia aurantia]